MSNTYILLTGDSFYRPSAFLIPHRYLDDSSLLRSRLISTRTGDRSRSNRSDPGKLIRSRSIASLLSHLTGIEMLVGTYAGLDFTIDADGSDAVFRTHGSTPTYILRSGLNHYWMCRYTQEVNREI